MKRNAIVTIDETTAQVTKAFQRQARIFGTDEYKMWKAYREDFPGAKMVTKTIKRNANKRTYRNLTYVNMGRYISIKSPELLEEFENTKAAAKAQENPYDKLPDINSNGKILYVLPVDPPAAEKDDATEGSNKAPAEHGELAKVS